MSVNETDNKSGVDCQVPSPSPNNLKFRPETLNVGSKINGINTLNQQITDYYRRRFGGDLTTRPMSANNSNSSPHSFRRFSSTSVDDLTLKSKFQALQWKFRNQLPLMVHTGGGPPPSHIDGSTPQSFRRKAGRLVDESFEFIDSEIKQSNKKQQNATNRRGLHRTEFEIQLPSSSRKNGTYSRSGSLEGNLNTVSNISSRKLPSNYQRRKTESQNNHLVEYSSNGSEVFAVYAKRNGRQGQTTNDVLAHRRNVQFDDQIRVLDRYQPELQNPTTGGFVRQLCAIVKPHKRAEYSSSRMNVISAYSPGSTVPKPMSPSDLESFYSVAKTCTLPSLPDGAMSPDDLESTVNNEPSRDVLYSADVDRSSITENPAFRDDISNNGHQQMSTSFNRDNEQNQIVMIILASIIIPTVIDILYCRKYWPTLVKTEALNQSIVLLLMNETLITCRLMMR